MYLTSIISNDIGNWQPNTMVLINATTGSGKTTFVIESLLPYAIRNNQEILYLSNRVILDRQVKNNVCELLDIPFAYVENEPYAELPGITLTTYQALEERLEPNKNINAIPYYDFIVLDEIHYMVTDSRFNPKVQRILKWLPMAMCRVKIAISATIEPVLPYLDYYNSDWITRHESEYLIVRERFSNKNVVNWLKGISEKMFVYNIPVNKPKWNVWVYEDIEEIVEFINSDDTDGKWLVFQSNKEKAINKLAKKIDKEWKMLSAEDKKTETMKQIVAKSCFDSKVLITTKVLDNGISIHDSKLVNIVIETTDKAEFQQMLGRRRIQENEDVELNIYVPKLSKDYFASTLRLRICPSLEFMHLTDEERLKVVLSSSSSYEMARHFCDVKENKFVVNPIAEEVLNAEKKYFENVVREMENDEMFFIKEQLRWIGIEESYPNIKNLRAIRIQKEIVNLEKILLRVENHELVKEQQNDFRELVSKKLYIILSNRFTDKSKTLGKKIIEDCLKEIGLPFYIDTIVGKKKGEKTKWIVRRQEKE